MADGSLGAKAPVVSRTEVSAIGGKVPFSFALIGMSFVGGLLDLKTQTANYKMTANEKRKELNQRSGALAARHIRGRVV